MKSEVERRLDDIIKITEAITAVESISDTNDNIDDAAVAAFLAESGALLEKELQSFKKD